MLKERTVGDSEFIIKKQGLGALLDLDAMILGQGLNIEGGLGDVLVDFIVFSVLGVELFWECVGVVGGEVVAVVFHEVHADDPDFVFEVLFFIAFEKFQLEYFLSFGIEDVFKEISSDGSMMFESEVVLGTANVRTITVQNGIAWTHFRILKTCDLTVVFYFFVVLYRRVAVEFLSSELLSWVAADFLAV